MRTIVDPRNLSLEEITYRIEGLKESQHRILSYLIQGKNYAEISELLNMKRETVGNQVEIACERVGVSTRSQLVAMFTIWSCATSTTKLDTWKNFHDERNNTQYGVSKLEKVTRIVTKGLKLWTHKP